MTSKTGEGTASLDKALDVLDAVGHATSGLSQADLGQRLGLPRTTLYRLLGTLVARGLLRRDPLRRVYCLGARCFEYARAAYSMPDLVVAALGELRALRDMSGETTYLSALDGLEMISLERCDGVHAQRSHGEVGQRRPLHCTAPGKALLAALPPERREALLRDIPLPAQTQRTITDRRRLFAELRTCAQRGWAVDDAEAVEGMRCCAAAIVDAHGEVRGAVSVAGPAYRLTPERIQLLGPEVAEAARRIGAQLAMPRPAGSDGEAQVVPGEWAFEGAFPCWVDGADDARLWWADRLAPALHAASIEGDGRLAGFDDPIRALLPASDGVRVLAGEAWYFCEADGRRAAMSGGRPPGAASLERNGPSSAWPKGLIAACMGPGGQPWLCVPDGERWRVWQPPVGGTGSGDGWRLGEPATALAWSEAQRTLYIAASGSGTLYAAQAGQSAVRRLATVPRGSGQLGGLAVDAEGGLWTALRGGWSVARFEDDGTLDRVVPLPVPAPTAVAFGGRHGRTLFVTTAREALDREALDAAPLSGRLFVVPPA